MIGPLTFEQEPSQFPADERSRHEEIVDLFGHFIFWLRNASLRASKTLIESDNVREELGTIRRRYYDGVAKLSAEDRESAMLLAEETLNGFLERLLWSLGDEGTDSRIGKSHAYRFRIEMEIVDLKSEAVVQTESINRGGKFFGTYWGRWLNRHQDK